MADKIEKNVFATPIGRVINAHVFEKDAYKDPRTGKEGTPKYNIEMAFDPADIGPMDDELLRVASAKWGNKGEAMYRNGEIRSPFLDGDKLAERRAEKGKKGDGYVGKKVIRASTIFDLAVFKADGKTPMPIEEKDTIYPGCEGRMALVASAYDGNGGDDKGGLKFYLQGFQRTGDGERLSSGSDYSKVFEPVGDVAEEAENPFAPTGRTERRSK